MGFFYFYSQNIRHMKKITILFFILSSVFAQAQSSGNGIERFPVFPSCQNLQSIALENCFYREVQDFVFNNFKVHENLKQSNYKGSVIVLFEVDDTGTFKVQYVDAIESSLVDESKRVFGKLPKISPPTYNGKPTYSKYTIKIAIPLLSAAAIQAQKEADALAEKELTLKTKGLTEFDSIVYKKFENPQFESHLNIPFSHSLYSQFDDKMNQVGANNHTGSKPYTYAEVNKYYNLIINYLLSKNI